MKKLIKKIIALMAVFQLFANIPVLGVLNVSAAENFAYQDALIPIEAFATAIAIGSGIVASENEDAINAASNVISRAIASLKAKSCGDASTAFRVIRGGKAEKPEKGDDKNNNRWFVRGAAAVATGKLFADLTASQRMMEEINAVNGYDETTLKTGLLSRDNLINECGVDAITNRLESVGYKGWLGVWKDYLEWFYKIVPNSEINNYIFYVCTSDENMGDYSYPDLAITAFKLNDKFSYFKYNNDVKKYISSYSKNKHLIDLFTYGGTGVFYDEYDKPLPLQYRRGNSNSSITGTMSTYKSSFDSVINAYFGLDFVNYILYQLTNNTYKAGESTAVNFPDWVQSSIETINGNLEAINLAINSLQLPQTWNDTQTNIQTGTAPANVINQYINNWSNPEQAPNPEPGPGQNPEPEPEPEPGDQPAAEAAVEESGKDLFDWAMKKITLPDGFFDKLPFSIPYDIYLLLKSLFPSSKSSVRRVYSVRSDANVGDTDPNGITISSRYEASGISTKTHSNKWVKTAPVINLDIHWKYHGVDGKEKTIDIVKKVDLSNISYFAMIVYISIYVFWFFELLSWIMSSFKG